MRTRTAWLAMLLMTGVALAPTALHAQTPTGEGTAPFEVPVYQLNPYTARGQIGSPTNDYDVPRADPAYPLPLFHDRPETGGFFLAAEAMFWRQSNPLRHQLIAVRGLVDNDGSIHQAIPPGTVFNTIGGLTTNPSGPGLITNLPGTRETIITSQTATYFPNGVLASLQTVFGFIFTPGQQIAQPQGQSHPGGFIGTARPALFADDAGGPSSYTPGYTVTAGYRFREGFTAELSWTHLTHVKYSGGATLIPQGGQLGPILEDSFLYSPVYNFPTAFAGPSQKLALGNPLAAYGIWNGATEMVTKFDQRYDEWNIGTRVPMIETDCWRCYGFAGLRHVWMWERFKWRTVAYDFQGLADATDAVDYSNIVSNAMYGGYVGCGNECYLGHGFSVSLDTKAALLIDFVREIARYERGDRATGSKRSRREYSIVPELDAQLNLNWYPIEGVELRLGYDAKNFFNTIASPNPVSFNYLGLDPVWEHKAYRLVDGFRAGISLTF